VKQKLGVASPDVPQPRPLVRRLAPYRRLHDDAEGGHPNVVRARERVDQRRMMLRGGPADRMKVVRGPAARFECVLEVVEDRSERSVAHREAVGVPPIEARTIDYTSYSACADEARVDGVALVLGLAAGVRQGLGARWVEFLGVCLGRRSPEYSAALRVARPNDRAGSD